MTDIGKNVLTRAAEMLKEQLIEKATDIDEAYLEMDDQLSISCGVKFSPGKNGTYIETTVKFKTGEVKTTGACEVNEMQIELPL